MGRFRHYPALVGVIAAALVAGCDAAGTMLSPDEGPGSDFMIVRARQGLGTATRLGGWTEDQPSSQGTDAGGQGTGQVTTTAVVGHATLDKYEVCVTYRGTPGPAVLIDYTVDFDADGVDITDFVTLSDGQCALIHAYRQTGSRHGTQPQVVGVIAQEPQGYAASYVRSFVPGADPITPASDPEVTGSSSFDTMFSNPDMGVSIVFIMTASGGGGGIIG